MDHFINQTTTVLENSIIKLLAEKYNCDFIGPEVKNILSTAKTGFRQINTEYMRLKKFEDSGNFILPENILLGAISGTEVINGERQINAQNVYAQFVPTRKVLKKFFELPTVFQRTMLYYNFLQKETTSICNFIQGSLWQ